MAKDQDTAPGPDWASNYLRKPRGWVYLIHFLAWHKIGAAGDPDVRLKKLDIMPLPMALIHRFASANVLAIERALHYAFRERHVRGEWFLLSPREVMAIQSIDRCDHGEDLPAEIKALVPQGHLPPWRYRSRLDGVA